MAQYLPKDLPDGRLPREIGEVITVEIHYPQWIVDAQRIDIERAVENCFSAWLTRLLQGDADTARHVLGKEDYEDFKAARMSIFDSLPRSVLGTADPYALPIKPGFILFQVDKGGHKTSKIAALNFWQQLFIGVAASTIPPVVMFGVGGTINYIEHRQPKETMIATSIVCTRQTAKAFVEDLHQATTKTERLKPEDVDTAVDKEKLELFQLIAAMPTDDCEITITATVKGEPVATFSMTRPQAEKTLRQIAANTDRR